MAGARQGIATAATRMRRLPHGSVMLAVLAFALLFVAGAQARADLAAETEVRLEVLPSPVGAVQVTPDLNGDFSCGPVGLDVCTFRYEAPTTVKLTAQPTVVLDTVEYRFYDWTAAECPRGVNECELGLTGDEPVVSAFALYDPARITMVISGDGTVTWPGGACVSVGGTQCETANLPAREPIIFSATPTSSVLWAFGCEPVPDNAGQCVARPENRVLGVSFDDHVPEPPFDVKAWLRVSKVGSGSGKITGSDFDCGSGDGCRRQLAFGRLVTLQAEPAAGSRFDGWVGVCASNPTCRFNAGPVTSVQARFVAAPPPRHRHRHRHHRPLLRHHRSSK